MSRFVQTRPLESTIVQTFCERDTRVWSWYHPFSKSILPLKAPGNVSFLPTRKRQPAAQFIDNLKLSLLTRSSRFFQRGHYCNRARIDRSSHPICCLFPSALREYARRRRTDLMRAARPQNPAPLAAAGVRGEPGSTPQGGKQTKTKILRNPQNFSYEVSHLRGHGMMSRPKVSVKKRKERNAPTRLRSIPASLQPEALQDRLGCGERNLPSSPPNSSTSMRSRSFTTARACRHRREWSISSWLIGCLKAMQASAFEYRGIDGIRSKYEGDIRP